MIRKARFFGEQDAVSNVASDTQLVDEFRKGSREAFEALVQRHQLAVRWQISRLVDHPQAADDLSQEVFLDLIRASRSTKGPNSVRAWLIATARNKAVDHIRHDARKPISIAIEGLEISDQRHADSSQSHSPALSDADLQLAALEHCLGLLKPEHRELVDEFYLQAKSSELIAARIGKGSASVRMMLLRIRKALGKCIRKQIESWKS